MSPAPFLPTDLDYADNDQVQLDVDAIIARGVRLRRRRLLAKVAIATAVAAITPTVILTETSVLPPPVHSVAGPYRDAAKSKTASPRPLTTPNAGDSGPAFGTASVDAGGPAAGTGIAGPVPALRSGLNSGVAPAAQRLSATVPPRFGPVLAIAGARSSAAVWFTAESTRLTLFRLSEGHKLRSWPLPAASTSLPARSRVAMTVTKGGVVWIAVSAMLIRYDPRSSVATSWHVPAPRSNRLASRRAHGQQPTRTVNSVAVSSDGDVAVAMSRSSSVQVLDPGNGTFSDYALPAATDQPLAVGYTLSGTLGIGFRDLGRARSDAVMLVKPSGALLTADVAQASAVTSYGRSGLLLGTGRPDVVSSGGKVRPLFLPADPQNFADDTSPPVLLPGDRLGIVIDSGIVTFPAAAPSVASAASESHLWLTPAPRCARGSGCPAGYGPVASDAAGGVWAVPNADPRAIVLLGLG